MKRNKGLTIIELLITVALLGIIFALGIKFVKTFFDVWLKSQKEVNVQQTARIAMDEMVRFIRQADEPVSGIYPPSGSSDTKISFDHVDGRSFKYYRGDSSTKAEDSGGNALFRVISGVTSTLVDDNVKSIYFVHSSSYIVRIASFTVSNGEESITLDKNVYIRNP